MNSQNRRKLIFALLLIPLLYIWGNNLNWFSGSSSRLPRSESSTSIHALKDTPIKISYSPPKINPFATVVTTEVKQKTNSPDNKLRMQQHQLPPRPSNNYSYVGFIERPPHSQAVMANLDQSTIILEQGDSLGPWHLSHITPTLTIFQFEKECDSLKLIQ